jgi:hypothetical protein
MSARHLRRSSGDTVKTRHASKRGSPSSVWKVHGHLGQDHEPWPTSPSERGQVCGTCFAGTRVQNPLLLWPGSSHCFVSSPPQRPFGRLPPSARPSFAVRNYAAHAIALDGYPPIHIFLSRCHPAAYFCFTVNQRSSHRALLQVSRLWQFRC